jgi:hypothetical protein
MEPSASNLINICRKAYLLTVDAIKKKLRSGNEVSLALNGGISTNRLFITSVTAYYMDQNWALQEVQLTFEECDCHFFWFPKSRLRIIGQGSTYWGKASDTFERRFSAF